MSSFGVTDEGFVIKDTDTINSEIAAEQKSLISSALNTQADSTLGKLDGVFAAKLNEIWELCQSVYRAFQPDFATGESLDQLAALTGTTRLEATASLVTLTLNLDASVTVPTGSQVSSDATGIIFSTIADAVNPNAWSTNVDVIAAATTLGALDAPAGTLDTIETPVAGWTSNAAITGLGVAPFTLSDGQTLLVSVDGGAVQTATFNTADFADIGNATAAEVITVILTDITGVSAVAVGGGGGSVRIESDNTGPGSSIQITGGTSITKLQFGTTAVLAMNDEDAQLGIDDEDDAALRLRRAVQVSASGSTSVDAIRSAILAVAGVSDARVFENTSLVTDGDGVPGKAIECIVLDGLSDPDIAQAIFDNKAAGILAHGNGSLEVIVDDQGFSHTILFTRASEISPAPDVEISTDPDIFGGGVEADGIQEVRDTIVAFVNSLLIGEDVIALAVQCAILEVPGVLDVTFFDFPVHGAPTNIPIGDRQVARMVDADITNVVVA